MAGISGDSQLFEEDFTIVNVDQSKYDRVARLEGTSTDAQTVMTLDINTELFPCVVGENLHCVLTTTLNLDGSKEDESGWRDATKANSEPTLADHYDYVCHGKIYKFEDGEDGQTMYLLP
jgi:DNA-directed RNA polymerases I, II, and III subunit RPABC3